MFEETSQAEREKQKRYRIVGQGECTQFCFDLRSLNKNDKPYCIDSAHTGNLLLRVADFGSAEQIAGHLHAPVVPHNRDMWLPDAEALFHNCVKLTSGDNFKLGFGLGEEECEELKNSRNPFTTRIFKDILKSEEKGACVFGPNLPSAPEPKKDFR